MNIAILGCTGIVGRELLGILDEREFPVDELRLLASDRSAGRSMSFRNRSIPVESVDDRSFDDIDLAFFSAGAAISRQFAPRAVEAGAIVIDNSSAFRMDANVPLITPEVNGDELDRFTAPGVIANPNCTAIIALLAVTPLHRAARIKRMVISTYQAASGAGIEWMDELQQQARDFVAGRELTQAVVGRPYLFNLFSHNTPIGPDGYNDEERKVIAEAHKMWRDESVRIAITCIRVPVLRAHCESINLTFERPLSEDQAREILSRAPGVRVVDDRERNQFPEPRLASGKDEVLVGRIRGDVSQPPGRGLELFVAGDQLRKGAALNAVQIAEQVMKRVPWSDESRRGGATLGRRERAGL